MERPTFAAFIFATFQINPELKVTMREVYLKREMWFVRSVKMGAILRMEAFIAKRKRIERNKMSAHTCTDQYVDDLP